MTRPSSLWREDEEKKNGYKLRGAKELGTGGGGGGGGGGGSKQRQEIRKA